jgi:hypothetical protein
MARQVESIAAVGVVVWQDARINGTASIARFANTVVELLEGSRRRPLLPGPDLIALPEERDQAVQKTGGGRDGL